MKFSLVPVSALILSSAISYVTADSYADAIAAWCNGLEVAAPASDAVVVAGQNTTITVTRTPNNHTKTITGLDLYSVSSNGSAKYVQNIWSGSYSLNTQASMSDQIPTSVSAGLYYYRVWVTNMIDSMHGPDCLETSHTFKVTTGSHTNAFGETEYAESLHDNRVYNSEHYDGCFGLSVDYPKANSTFNANDHVHVQVSRDSASQTGALTQIDLYKGENLINIAWKGSESFQSSFTLKDHLLLPNVDKSAKYHYRIHVASKKSSEKTCTFKSELFKIGSTY